MNIVLKWAANAAQWTVGPKARPPDSLPAVPLARVKAAAEALIAQSHADIGTLATRLTNGELTAAQFETEMRVALKNLHIANAGLGRGGIENLTPDVLARVEAKLAAQYEYLNGFAQAIADGKLNERQVGTRALSYGDAGRAVYENEYLGAKADAGFELASRILGALDHCVDCVEWAALGWMPIDEMESNYAIGDSVCNNRCGCVIIFRRNEDSPQSAAAAAAIEAAQGKKAAYDAAKKGDE